MPKLITRCAAIRNSYDSARQALREQSGLVAMQMKQAGHASAFLARHDQLLAHFNPHGRPAQWQSASRDAVRTLANEWPMDRRLADEVINTLRAEQSGRRTSTPTVLVDTRSAESARHSQASVAFAARQSSVGLSIDHIGRLRDIYNKMLARHDGNVETAMVDSTFAFHVQFPNLDKGEITRKLSEIRAEAAASPPSPVPDPRPSGKLTDKEVESLGNIYNKMLARHGDDVDTAKREAQIAFQDAFPGVRLLSIKRQLKEISNQPRPSTPDSVHVSSPEPRGKGDLSSHEIQSLGAMYKRILKHYDGDVDTAILKTRLFFQETNPDVRSKDIKRILRNLSNEPASNQPASSHQPVPADQSASSRPSPVPESRSPINLSTGELEVLQDTYSQILGSGGHDTASARRQAASAFAVMFPQFQSSEHELAQLLRGSGHPTPPGPLIGPRQGEVRLTGDTRVRCGVASPNPVDPGQHFYREHQTTNQTTCAQHSLNALVGWNAFDMNYIEQVKYDLIAKAVGMSVEDVIKMEDGTSGVSGQDPEVLAECLRRKAQAGEIDPRWKNAKAEFAVGVNDELWARLAQEKPDGMIIGRTDANYSHYVAQRTDSSGQARILDSMEKNEINMTSQEYIEANLLAKMAATEDGTKRIHLITC
jgi:hypothetical protein